MLSNFPAQAVILKTNLLRAVLDLVGAPLSLVDVDADPLGLHPLSALKWLECLLVKCKHAFAVQMDGSLCSQVPPLTAVTTMSRDHREVDADRDNSHDHVEVDDTPDLAGKLVG